MSEISQLATDRVFLKSIAANDYKVPEGIDGFEFVKALSPNFYSTDAQLRDQLTYSIIASTIVTHNRLNNKELETLLHICMDEDHLFYRIGESGSDSVFMRSFAVLVVAAVLKVDNEFPALPLSVIHKVKVSLIRYAKEERDRRGYVEGKGWAHSAAHVADALDELGQHRYIETVDCEQVLNGIQHIATTATPLYAEEDDRLAYAAYRIVTQRSVKDLFLDQWISTFPVKRGSTTEGVYQVANAKNFLRSLYFRLLWSGQDNALTSNILDKLNEIDREFTPQETS